MSVGQGPSLSHSLVPVYNLFKLHEGEGVEFHVPDWDILVSKCLCGSPLVFSRQLTWAAWIFRNPSPCLELQSPQLGSTVPLQWWTTEIQIPSQKHWADQQPWLSELTQQSSFK